MTKCCDSQIITFTNASVLSISYSINMRERFGNAPHVKVWHLYAGEYQEPMIEIKLNGVPTSTININNGGPATGFLKIFK